MGCTVAGALAFVGTGLLVFGLGRRLLPAKPWLPALVWALSFGPISGASVVSTDALLVFFETAAMLAFCGPAGVQMAPSRFVAEEDLCEEIAEHEDNVYALKEGRVPAFVDSMADCPGVQAERIGHFDGDGNRIALFVIKPVDAVLEQVPARAQKR